MEKNWKKVSFIKDKSPSLSPRKKQFRPKQIPTGLLQERMSVVNLQFKPSFSQLSNNPSDMHSNCEKQHSSSDCFQFSLFDKFETSQPQSPRKAVLKQKPICKELQENICHSNFQDFKQSQSLGADYRKETQLTNLNITNNIKLQRETSSIIEKLKSFCNQMKKLLFQFEQGYHNINNYWEQSMKFMTSGLCLRLNLSSIVPQIHKQIDHIFSVIRKFTNEKDSKEKFINLAIPSRNFQDQLNTQTKIFQQEQQKQKERQKLELAAQSLDQKDKIIINTQKLQQCKDAQKKTVASSTK